MISLTPNLDRESKVPLYLQLYTYIKGQIESGILSENDGLPSIRQLSSYLAISKNTVETAYQQLLAEGYIQSRSRSGLYVLPMETLTFAGNERQAAPANKSPVDEHVQSEGDRIDFEYGDVDLEHFPYKSWKKCLVESLDDCTYGVYGYGDRQGHAGLRREIAQYLFQSRGVVCDPSQIFLSAGVQQSISLLCQLLPLSNQVAMEDPGYKGVRAVFGNHGHEILPIPVEKDGLDVDQLHRSGARTVYVTPSHQFPLGVIMPIQNRTKLLQWAYDTDSYIIEDDYDSEFRHQGQPIPALKAMDTGDRVIYLGTFSKSFLPGARLSYAVLPDKLADTYTREMQSYSQSASPILQAAVYRFMDKGYFEGHLRKMRKLYQSRHKTLIHSIQEHLESRVGIIGQKSGMHLLLDVYGRQSQDLIDRANRCEVNVYSPALHWLNPEECPESYIMLGYAKLSQEKINEGIVRLREAWFD